MDQVVCLPRFLPGCRLLDEMRSITNSFIGELQSIPWFLNVGEPTTADVARASSWSQALELAMTPEWESVQFQVRNCLCFCVNRTNYARFTHWNGLVQAINGLIDPIVQKHAKPIAQREELQKNFEDGVAWDLMMACIETEFSDVCAPIFFLNQVLPWYRKGHYPCGWEGPQLQPGWRGPMPPGKLIVF